MTNLERLQLQTKEENTELLNDCLESAKNAILARRYPFEEWPEEFPGRYEGLQFRVALDLYNKIGAEGQISHAENGVSRVYESSWISEQLLSEITPLVGVL